MIRIVSIAVAAIAITSAPIFLDSGEIKRENPEKIPAEATNIITGNIPDQHDHSTDVTTSVKTNSQSCASGEQTTSDRVRIALSTTCAGCHMEGDKGFFASGESFLSLLVSNQRLVKAGDPDNSELVRLLEGRGTAIPQMPPIGKPFASLAKHGDTDISMADIRQWISDLDPVDVVSRSNPKAKTVNRLSAKHYAYAVRELLGLTPKDFFAGAKTYGVIHHKQNDARDFAVQPMDDIPGNWRPIDAQRYIELGGGSALTSITEDRSINKGFIQTLVPLSQRWCEKAIVKQNNPILRSLNPETANEQEIQRNIRRLYLLFLGEVPSEPDIDQFYHRVYAPLRAESNAIRAWIGLCAAFIQDPLFNLY